MATIEQSKNGRYAVKLNALLLGVYSNKADAINQQQKWQLCLA